MKRYNLAIGSALAIAALATALAALALSDAKAQSHRGPADGSARHAVVDRAIGQEELTWHKV